MHNLQIGRPELHPYVVAVKKTADYPIADTASPDGLRSWPIEFDDALARAREAYCDGTHEMAQGHADGMTIQYLIPKAKAEAPRPFPLARCGEVEVFA